MKAILTKAANAALVPVNLFLRVEVSLLMNSGERVNFTCKNITVDKSHDNRLTGITTEKQRGFPLYTRLADISAVQTRRIVSL